MWILEPRPRDPGKTKLEDIQAINNYANPYYRPRPSMPDNIIQHDLSQAALRISADQLVKSLHRPLVKAISSLESIARECRIQGMATAGAFLADAILEPLRDMLDELVKSKSIPADLAAELQRSRMPPVYDPPPPGYQPPKEQT